MVVMDPGASENDIVRVWQLLSEVSEQLSQNRSFAVNLHVLADGSKAQAIHSQTGFVLRRFNLDKSKEAYDAELERMNSAMSAENMTLLNDNRQLSALIREYEQTLENVMATFRTRANEVQQRELALMRQYESVLIQRETEALEESLAVDNARTESLARAGRLMRAVMRRLGGEDVHAYEAYQQAMAHPSRSQNPSDASTSNIPYEVNGTDSGTVDGVNGKGKERAEANGDESADDEGEEEPEVDVDRLLEEEDDPEKRLAAAEWALDRESELARLERENEELRALAAGLLKPPPTAQPAAPSMSAPPHAIPEHGEGDADDHAAFTLLRPQHQRLLGGPPGSVGPFGTYKKSSRIG